MHANDLFETITAQLITDIEGGAGAWRMPWHRLADTGAPISADGRAYRGLNSVWLSLIGASLGYESGIYSTYRSLQRHGAQVRRGERGHAVILWKPVTTAAPSDDAAAATTGHRRLVARTFTVFAAEQTDGADRLVARFADRRSSRDTPERLAAADAYFAAAGLQIIEGGDRAFYQPAADTIHVPALAQFHSAPLHAGTTAHEACHATGHESRIDRDLTGRFGSDAYAAEELVAELGAAMWCAQMGISAATRPDHAAYISSWLRILGADARALVTVANKAQAAVDWLNSAAGYASVGPIADELEPAIACRRTFSERAGTRFAGCRLGRLSGGVKGAT